MTRRGRSGGADSGLTRRGTHHLGVGLMGATGERHGLRAVGPTRTGPPRPVPTQTSTRRASGLVGRAGRAGRCRLGDLVGGYVVDGQDGELVHLDLDPVLACGTPAVLVVGEADPTPPRPGGSEV